VFCANFTVVQGQHFETTRFVNQNDVPTDAFLYKHPASVIKKAAQNVFARYDVSSFFEGTREYFSFSGDSLGLVLLSRSYIKFWIENLGDDKSVLYLSAFAVRTNQYTPSLRHTVVQQKIRRYLTAIEKEAINISNHLFLSEQSLKVEKLAGELQKLQNELYLLESYEPEATTQINQLRSTIRTKRAQLNQETYILNRLRAIDEV